MVFLPTNQHTLTGDLSIVNGEISSPNTDMLLTSGTFQYIGFHNSLTTTTNVFSFNHYTHINHNGRIQRYWGEIRLFLYKLWKYHNIPVM